MPRNKGFFKDFTINNVSVGIVTGILGVTGPAALVSDAATLGNLTTSQVISWVFAVYFFGGLYSIVFPLVYKMPITGAHSISAAAFLAISMANFPFSDFVGAYIMSGVIIFILGITGIFNVLMKLIPTEIISAMLAGLVTNYVVAIIPSSLSMPIIGLMAFLGFLIVPRLVKSIPPILGALFFSGIALFFLKPVEMNVMEINFMLPQFQTPTFSIEAFFAITLPLVLLILSNDAAQGIGGLKSFGYDPPITKLISFSGVASILTGFFGGHCANLAGMMSSMCAGNLQDPKEKRYISSMISGVILLLFGIFSWVTVGVLEGLRPSFISLIAGFALTGVLVSSLKISFSNTGYHFSTLFTFIIALSNVQLFNVSSPVWSLIIGTILAKLMGEGQIKEKLAS